MKTIGCPAVELGADNEFKCIYTIYESIIVRLSSGLIGASVTPDVSGFLDTEQAISGEAGGGR